MKNAVVSHDSSVEQLKNKAITAMKSSNMKAMVEDILGNVNALVMVQKDVINEKYNKPLFACNVSRPTHTSKSGKKYTRKRT